MPSFVQILSHTPKLVTANDDMLKLTCRGKRLQHWLNVVNNLKGRISLRPDLINGYSIG